ncbi:hypothetical protein NM208_g7384 [Fusarium decemcellulare]|uniref:Uncharacterized protein n=1 Tax=Fusarium decemcellulare TaxID=57161 RepID=A0ACC1S9D4_9HYPO|nr:hypothetical protein NM208_g7384 [Fusarium decemcellulare]
MQSPGQASAPMGQFVQPAPSGGLRSPRPQLSSNNTIQNTTLTAPEKNPADLPLLSPYTAGSGNWASMVNTPMTSTFNTANAAGTQADMVANATAMKLAALSTVNNRFALDDVRKYRRTRSNDGAPGSAQNSISAGPQPGINLPGANVVMINEHGQVLSREQLMALQAQQNMSLGGQRSRPSSPGLAMQPGMPHMAPFTSPQNNGFLSAYDGSSPLMSGGLPSVNLGGLGVGGGHEGYLSDHSDMVRGRSPRGRRGSSKPPEDPTDPTLLQDIPSWLRSLRLHKYTDNLKDMKWTDLIELDDKALEERGVNALGARRKMLKVFDQVKGKQQEDASDADSDLEELEGDIAKFDESVREFLAAQRDEVVPSPAVRGGPRGRGARGPRKAAKPRGDITARLSRVNQAFLSGDYSRALDLVFEVIRINAETHQAWTTLSSIFREQGDLSKALSAMVYAAHLRPKDVGGWLQCASFALDTIGEDEAGNLNTARLCYSAALRADHTNLDARLGKGLVCHRQGHLAAAISDYKTVLKHRPYDLEIVRKLAEACVDNKQAETAVPSAIAAYKTFFDHEQSNPTPQMMEAPWHDIGIYVELFASTGRYQDAIYQAKSLSRWLLGRGAEQFWDDWQSDDREWDGDDERRLSVPEFTTGTWSPDLYGQSFPWDLRARLAIYRFRLGDDDEAMRHLWWFDPASDHTKEFAGDFPFLASDLAQELGHRGQTPLAISYYQILRDLPGDADATILLQLGRCHSAMGENATAEEYFLAAIDADEDNIDARIELANMYEKAREEEEALILAAEALALREARDQDADSGLNPQAVPIQPNRRVPRRSQAVQRRTDASGKRLIPRRYRPKRLAGADKRRQEEQARAVKLTEQYEVVQALRKQIREGREDLVPAWMASSKELVDDFRSLKKFYTWDKYLHYLGPKNPLQQNEPDKPQTELSQMYERLARTLAPNPGQEGREAGASELDAHQGISFNNWLDLFMDYAIGLAIAHRRDEAYQVCEAARDSTAFQAPEHGFIIYVAWSVCAIYTSDEEKCVATARQLMREGAMSDSYRMFAMLSNLCQSPVSWYTSGPAQKYLLRQIKAMDDAYTEGTSKSISTGDTEPALDACVLMLYGHILFTSTSYTYALGYFLRSRALDPDNPMVNLSLGLAYVHYGLKRQSTNRQYLLLQGQSFLSRYAELGSSGQDQNDSFTKAEAYYNIGRLYQLLGINYLALEYYSKAKRASHNRLGEGGTTGELEAIVLSNELISLLINQNNSKALALLKAKIRL